MKCPNPDCGAENRDGAKYCRNCGKHLGQKQETNPWTARIAWAITGLALGFITGVLLGSSLANSVYEPAEDTEMVVALDEFEADSSVVVVDSTAAPAE